MAAMRDAMTRLAGLEVPGVVHNHDIDETPATLERSQAPALLVLLPGLGERQGRCFSSGARPLWRWRSARGRAAWCAW